ncbi:hypothetical protein CC1G_08072 [Coprinopsis cinerea okayama7|uniref:F-box domain-containing protein n=1 Tax=Coprinopsis cinerea (strain Okayama-7 / 130 / ATCC MYA-4618 / FGSC 9003) TaxID=240176 RepID=A8NVM8_COPC7|nr:hypothetical protein CC1G_08072 [Coprinopsis cinerea okayama7\|eukprot:XP_001836687.1 hypothetical protein CC1G_08072 [Coprinopsis cinerea okayama7\
MNDPNDYDNHYPNNYDTICYTLEEEEKEEKRDVDRIRLEHDILLPILTRFRERSQLNDVLVPLSWLRLKSLGMFIRHGLRPPQRETATREEGGGSQFDDAETRFLSPSGSFCSSLLSLPELSPCGSSSSTSSSSPYSSTSDQLPPTPLDTESTEVWIASSSSEEDEDSEVSFLPPTNLQRKRKRRTPLWIRIPEGRAVPDVQIERDCGFLLLSRLPKGLCYNIVKQSMFLERMQDCKSGNRTGAGKGQGIPSFVSFETYECRVPSRFGQDVEEEEEPSALPVPAHGPLTLKAHFGSSLSIEEANQRLLDLSAFFCSDVLLPLAPRIFALDIALPEGYAASWDVSSLPLPLDYRFDNLEAFRWKGVLAANGLPAPFYDFNSLPLGQMREVVLEDCELSSLDLKRLLYSCPALESLTVDSIVEDDVELRGLDQEMDLRAIVNVNPGPTRLDAPELRVLRLTTSADLNEVFCLLDAPYLKEVVYRPRGCVVEPVRLGNFPWNVLRGSLERLSVIVGGCGEGEGKEGEEEEGEKVDWRVREELELFAKDDDVDVRIEVR